MQRCDPNGRQSFGYDAHGRQKIVSDARTGTTTKYFNNADQVSGLITPAPGAGQSAQVTSNYFDNLGWGWKSSLPDGTSVTNESLRTDCRLRKWRY